MRDSKRACRRPRQGMKKCGLLRRASSCLNDDSYDEDMDEHTDDTTTSTAQPRPSKIARTSSTNPPSISASSSSPSLSLSPTAHPTIVTEPTNKPTAKPDPQPQSPFFTRLPIEVRRLVYDALFRSTNPLMKTHIHAAYDSARLTTTPCQYTPSATYSTRDDEADPMQTDPWPGWRGKNQPPRWFWHAWGLRLRWGPHWKCQEAAMLDWKTRGDGTCVDLRGKKGGWMGIFLSCRQMYGEAIEYFFESTTLIFTASEDAFRFFLQNQHSHLYKIHDLDLTFNHFKDHLFLQPIESKHPHLLTTNSLNVAPVASELWLPLMACLRERLPELRSLRIHLGPPSAAKGRVFMDLLRDWERDGYGWVEESIDGMVYLERGRPREMLQDGKTSGIEEGEAPE